jgi:hypothetical protein
MTITIGLWVIPLIVTIISFVTASIRVQQVAKDAGAGSWGEGILIIAFHGLALIASLIAWLIWAVLT